MASLFSSSKFKKLLDLYPADEPGQPPEVIDLYRNPLRQRECEHIENIFAQLPNNSYKEKVQTKLLSENSGDHIGAWYELMVYDWLVGLGKNPIPQPVLQTTNGAEGYPDFLIESNGLQIYIEVSVIQEAQKDKDRGIGGVVWTETTRTFEKIGDKLREKMGKYEVPSDSAYVICLGLESRLIDLGEVKTYFLGDEVDLFERDDIKDTIKFRGTRLNPNGEIFVNDNDIDGYLAVKHRDVSALLVAKRNMSGYRPTFGLIQNPYALVHIPETEFGSITRWVRDSETELIFKPGER
jgi:hypothetical protein